MLSILILFKLTFSLVVVITNLFIKELGICISILR